MNAPEFTVVMPVYNAAATLEATVASVLRQSCVSFELLAIDDGSSDDSLARLLDLAAEDERIRVIAIRNGGVSAARNLGIELARAPLIAFIDSDDLWDPGKLASHADLHRANPKAAASYARIAFIAQDAGDLTGARTLSSLCPHPITLPDVLGENPVCTASNLVVRRTWFDVVGGFDEALSFAEDQEMVARIVAHGGHLAGIDAVLTGYRFSPDGLSANFSHMHEGWRQVACRYLDGAAVTSLDALYCRYLSRRVLRSGRNPSLAMSYAVRGLQLDARAFLRERRRGLSTILGAIAAPALPQHIRRRVFA